VTIIGPGGIGKTWLAVELGWRLAPEFPDGVYLIDLAPVKEAAALASAIAQPLGIALRSTDTPSRIIGGSIDKRKLLLILDGCEYVTEDARVMTEALLAQAPNLSVLATSQAALRVPKEALFHLGPLGPEDAARLFIDTARASSGRFDPAGPNADLVAEICRRLDCLPLAIEIAAAAVKLHGIRQVLAGLDQRFRMLDHSPRPGERRHATLSAVMVWSHGLLDEAAREILRRLARFSGSFTAEAVGAVVWPPGTVDIWQAPAALGPLVDKSLLVQEPGDPPRYRLLETIAIYEAAALAKSGEADPIAERHARYYTGLFEKADLAWETMPDAEWLALYGPEIDNGRAALDWALEQPDRLPIAVALAGTVALLWERLNLPVEGRTYLDPLVLRLDDKMPTLDSARLLKQAGMLWRRSERLRALALTERAVQLYRQTDDKPGLGAALGFAGGDYVFLGRYDEAKAALAEAQTLLAGSDRIKSSLRVTINLSSLAQRESRIDDAKSALLAARDLARTLKDPLREYIVINNLAVIDFDLGSLAQAAEHFRDAASGFRSIDQPAYLGPALVNLAACLALQGADAEARVQATEALALTRVDGGTWLRLCLERWAFLAVRAGQYAEAARLLGFVEAGYARSGEVRVVLSQRICEETTRLLAAHCRADDLRAWAEDGACWSEEQAADFAVRRLTEAGS
jgi:predicted ATPase